MEFTKQYLAEKLLLVQLFNTVYRPGIGFALDVEQTALHDSMLRTEHSGCPILYSGTFIARGQKTILPFALPFRVADGVKGISLHSFAIGDNTARFGERVLSLLSLVDYLITTNQLRCSSISAAIRTITCNGKRDSIHGISEGYPAFRERCIKRLPYDMSLALLGESSEQAA
ncbi:hypothetical protein [Paraburkholderia phosphatilytica]|uniref:hypothetical protein n=1 Tax=Paraburkholderia phosphatilytica TaxID=2282883 RepID=UPI000E4CA339|nr:hypothetical protein [Paraburkholderia phosphatilytica]